MIKRYTFFFLLSGLVLSAQSGFAQYQDSFSVDPNVFPEHLEAFMNASGNEKAEATVKLFLEDYQTGLFSELEQERIIANSNRMRKRGMFANPHYTAFLNALRAGKLSGKEEVFLLEWHTLLSQVLEDEEGFTNGRVTVFFEFSEKLFSQNALRFVEKGSSWFLRESPYQLALENREVVLTAEPQRLTGLFGGDSIQIHLTRGRYLLYDEQWEGKGGTVKWERPGLDSTIFVELKDYTIDASKPNYKASGALLTYPAYFEGQIEGDFQDRISRSSVEHSGSYPRFSSYRTDLHIPKVIDNVSFKGGIRLEGRKIIGYGPKEAPAELKLTNREEVCVFRGLGNEYVIKPEESITGSKVAASFYFESDSIYHPSVEVRINMPASEFQLRRGESGIDRVPFFSSVHQININADYITAFTNADTVLIGESAIDLSNKAPVEFTSLKYFKEEEYDQLQNIATVNPLDVLQRQVGKERSRFVSAAAIAKALNTRYEVENIFRLIYDLAEQGFINFDPEEELIEVKDKTFHYVNAHLESADFDNIQFRSKLNEPNAILNLRNNAMRIKGVQVVELSPSKMMAVFPDTNAVVMRENRNMELSGEIVAGYTKLTGKDYQFNYDNFDLTLDSVQSMQLFIPQTRPETAKELGEQVEAFSLNSTIEQFSANLLIDAPSNKGGRENIPMFPSIRTTSPAYVFYDSDKVKDTVYVRDSFYFELEPFTMNELDNYVEEEVVFDGKLYSAGILETFREPLRVRKDDYSLGFVHNTPDAGYQSYGGKGVYSGQIDLSNAGLLGKGALQYLGAKINSESFKFHPEEATGFAEVFDLDESEEGGVEVPQVHGDSVNILWRPYLDSLYIQPEEKPFAMFKAGAHTLAGTLVLTPDGLKGDGLLDWEQASMESELFSFGAFAAQSDTLNLKIKAIGEDDIAIQTDNISGMVDFEEQIGSFRANEAILRTQLPYNRYQTTMNEFDWDMSKAHINFKADENQLGQFTSTAPGQDSLQFEGRTAFYNLNTYELKIAEVPYVKAADAFIYPDSGLVDIAPGGLMKTLSNAVIVADTLNQNHRIKRATVDIRGRKDYTATGFYEYNVAGKEQEIEFQNILGQRVGRGKMSEKATATRAKGEITEADSFFIDHKTLFYGTISLFSESVNLQFDGFARLEADRLPERNWFSISSGGDKENLAIRYTVPKSFEGYPLYTGLFLSRESAAMYPRVMMPRFTGGDRAVLPVEGLFRYNPGKDQFIFGDSSKVLNNDYRGNQLVFDNKTGGVEAEGRLNLGEGMDVIKIDAAGVLRTEFRETGLVDSTLMDTPPPGVEGNLIAGVSMILPEKLLRMVTEEVKRAGFGSTPIPYLSELDRYSKQFSMLFPASPEFDNALLSLGGGFFELPKKFNPYTFLFSDLEVVWDQDYQSLVNTNPQIGLVSMEGEPLNQRVKCWLEVKMPTNGDDRLYFYLELANNIFYYFGYKQGILEISSNDTRFMEEADKLKKNDLIVKDKKNNETYEIQVVENARAKMFQRRAQAAGGGR